MPESITTIANAHDTIAERIAVLPVGVEKRQEATRMKPGRPALSCPGHIAVCKGLVLDRPKDRGITRREQSSLEILILELTENIGVIGIHMSEPPLSSTRVRSQMQRAASRAPAGRHAQRHPVPTPRYYA